MFINIEVLVEFLGFDVYCKLLQLCSVSGISIFRTFCKVEFMKVN
jgi:hypothetical protein